MRRIVQFAALVLFCLPLLIAGWSLFGATPPIEDAAPTPADLAFFGSLSSSSIGGITLLDPFAILQTTFASKSFSMDWLIGALPVLVVYGLVRGRAFCGWICPVNLLLEGVDGLRKKLRIDVAEMPIPRHAKLFVALGILVLSALFSVPLFEALSPISAINKGLLFGSTVGLTTLVAIVLIELFWGHRTWCRALCPLGGFYEVLGRAGQVNIACDHAACTQCGACKRACLADPAILDDVIENRDVIVRAGDCMICGKCISACPTSALSVKLGRPGRHNASSATPAPNTDKAAS